MSVSHILAGHIAEARRVFADYFQPPDVEISLDIAGDRQWSHVHDPSILN